MNAEHTKYLIEHFPKLYRGVDKPLTESLMGFGFECGDGWFELIKELSEKLEPMGVEAVQVKEKWGGLRFYVDGATDEAWDIIEEAEQKSETICEACGAPGELRDQRYWVFTLCDECDKKERPLDP
jgi:hypothetical protein